MLKRCLVVVVPSVLFASCGDNRPPDEANELAQGDQPDAPGGDDEHPDPREIDADIFIDTITCVDTIARYEATARYVDDGSPALNIACMWTFDDGSTSDECIGEHLFAEAGAHDFVLEVTDLDTGAMSSATQTRMFAPPLALTLDVSSDDLSISYVATSNTGGEQVVRVSPEEMVVADDPDYPRATSGTVRVLEAGTYTVTYDVEDERGVSEICSGQVVKTVTATCDGGDHEH